MNRSDVTDTLELALQASGCYSANVAHKPRLLSDNGPCYFSGDLAERWDGKGMGHLYAARHITLRRRVKLNVGSKHSKTKQVGEILPGHPELRHKYKFTPENILTGVDTYINIWVIEIIPFHLRKGRPLVIPPFLTGSMSRI